MLKAQLSGGERRSVGEVEAAVDLVLGQPVLFKELFVLITCDDAIVRSRAANAVERVTREPPEWLQPHKKVYLERVLPIAQWEVRAHACQIMTRFELEPSEIRTCYNELRGFLDDKSSIVRTFTMQALFDLSRLDPDLAPEVTRTIRHLTESGTPAMRSRGRKLLKAFDHDAKRRKS